MSKDERYVITWTPHLEDDGLKGRGAVAAMGADSNPILSALSPHEPHRAGAAARSRSQSEKTDPNSRGDGFARGSSGPCSRQQTLPEAMTATAATA